MTKVTIHSNNLENIVIGSLDAKWSARGDRILRYYIDVRHTKLNLHKEVSAPEIFILQSKLDALMAGWDEKYATYQKRQSLLSGQAAADELTIEAGLKLDSLGRILAHTLRVDDKIDWETLKDRSKYDYPKDFPEPKPSSSPAKIPEYVEPKVGFFQLIMGKKTAIVAAAQEEHSAAVRAWDEEETRRKKSLAHATDEWEKRRKAFWDAHKAQEDAFKAEQAASHAEVDRLAADVASGDEEAVIEHASLVLERSDYDGLFEKSYLLQYDRPRKLIKLAYDLPSIDVLPSTKTVKFVKVSGELKESFISERERKANFETVAYQICLRTVHELFEADEAGNIDAVLFNGFVDFIDPATGLQKRSCLLSLLVDRPTFCAIDLARVEPKTCFKSLKGVSAASLASLAPIAPVMELDTEDRRFVDAREVGAALDEGTNLAAMSWEDFEHLVRELFEKEFASRGGEVKITQSSSDGGVDAVAFDPDPITGGKIVIQAKRYTRTVGVSAVRDLYGTMINEGASRGILVTTADYGPDAYSFANGKPITLMNGANLLHMLERHGFTANIDIAAARRALT
ncbi:restriction endonuclease [Sphingopyxis terrae]|uniref:Restriction system protein n=1 Tax=Sphingopyxis terrae subsp. ummariensis TaxID=429001 RepID=A0A1Y6FNN2_9SPHN|nr:restriction endonuclease [Sphingopyxis terrae]PCF91070.1 restriction endonuclease [Sphingopyxis terrae subsp. ummariensis]SMQ76297.1 restriction system protein [Sphingopyxis terrae subsp. ummariensis]